MLEPFEVVVGLMWLLPRTDAGARHQSDQEPDGNDRWDSLMGVSGGRTGQIMAFLDSFWSDLEFVYFDPPTSLNIIQSTPGWQVMKEYAK